MYSWGSTLARSEQMGCNRAVTTKRGAPTLQTTHLGQTLFSPYPRVSSALLESVSEVPGPLHPPVRGGPAGSVSMCSFWALLRLVGSWNT